MLRFNNYAVKFANRFFVKNSHHSIRTFAATPINNQAHVRVLRSNSHNPWFNLATEEWIFKEMDPTHHTLFLWRNDKTVVIGRHQNPWKECHLRKMEEDGIFLARRTSGGGAVYQDLGNTCFTFMSPRAQFDKSVNNGIIISALRNLFNIHAEASGRNDIIISDSKRKISGSAFKQTNDRAFHHGTLLINVDLAGLQKYLNPDKKKLESKGITSVVSRVVNLQELNKEVTHETLSDAIIKEFFEHYGATCPIEDLDHEKLAKIDSLNAHYKELSDWEWRFGKSPAFANHFETRFDWGIIDINANVVDGVISEVKIFSDTLFPQLVDALEASLRGARYSPEGVRQAMVSLRQQFGQQENSNGKADIMRCIDELEPWIIQEIH